MVLSFLLHVSQNDHREVRSKYRREDDRPGWPVIKDSKDANEDADEEGEVEVGHLSLAILSTQRYILMLRLIGPSRWFLCSRL